LIVLLHPSDKVWIFCYGNELKFTYEHLQFKKFVLGSLALAIYGKGRATLGGREGEGGRGEEGGRGRGRGRGKEKGRGRRQGS
jgi:hypothetical protein